MFYKKPLSSLIIALMVTLGVGLAPNFASAVVQLPTATLTPSSTSVEQGATITFDTTFLCPVSWSTATAQLYDGPTSANKPLGSTFEIAIPQQQIIAQSQSAPAGINRPQGIQPGSGSKTITFNQSGQFNVYLSITRVEFNNTSSSTIDSVDACEGDDLANTAITVITPATTTVAPAVTTSTTTLAPTTTVTATALPKTGSDSTNALIALAAAIAGGAIILGRRRLLAK